MQPTEVWDAVKRVKAADDRLGCGATAATAAGQLICTREPHPDAPWHVAHGGGRSVIVAAWQDGGEVTWL